MSYVCEHCGEDCRPLATNAIGVEVQRYTHAGGWKAASVPYPTSCEAEKALQALEEPQGTLRIYTALAKRKDPLTGFVLGS